MATTPQIVGGGSSAETTSLIQLCPGCRTGLDVSEGDLLSQAICPECGATLIVGEFLDHYKLLEIAGRGGMGVVYKALDTSLDRIMALKVLRKDRLGSHAIAQLENEATITASINHPHVVKVYTTGSCGGRFYIAMELVESGTLEDLIRVQQRIAEAQMLDVAIQVADGLRAAWRAGMIHRDVKPGNILFAGAHTAKIVDFGLAIAEQAAAEAVGSEIWGTPYYIAPEKLDQQPEDLRGDIYSLGATLFHALAGRPPFEAENASLVALKHVKSQAVSLQAFAPWVSGSTAYIVNRTLLKNPGERYQNYDELIGHLQYAKSELVGGGRNPKPRQRVVIEDAKGQKVLASFTVGMLALAAIVAFIFFFALHKGGNSPAAHPAVDRSSLLASSPDFKEGAVLLSKGQYPKAAAAFHAASEKAGASGPLLQWALFHEGLALLLEKKAPESRAVFKKLASHPLIATDPDMTPLSEFFARVAAGAGDEQPILAETVHFDRNSYESLGLLVFGLKDWQLGYGEESAPLSHEMLQGKTPSDWPWIADVQTEASAMLDAYTQSKILLTKFASASDLGEKASIATNDLRRADHAFSHLVDGALKSLNEETLAQEEFARSLPLPGIYQIINHKTRLALEVENSDENDKAGIQQTVPDASKANQKWLLYPLGAGNCLIVALHSGKAFCSDGLRITQESWNGDKNQRWKLERHGDGSFALCSSLDGKYCSMGNERLNEAAGLVQAGRKDDPGLSWDFVHNELPLDIPDGTYRIINAHSLKMLEVYRTGLQPGASVDQWPYVDGKNQCWRIRRKSDGWLQIIAEHSGQALDVYDLQDRDGAKIEQWTAFASKAQLWKADLDPGRGYKLHAACSPRVLSVTDQSKDSGALVTIRSFAGNPDQYWLLVPVL